MKKTLAWFILSLFSVPAFATTPSLPSPVPKGVTPPPQVLTTQNIGDYLPIDTDVPGESVVSIGPYMGVPLVYSGSNLIINTPSINEDAILLTLRKNIHQKLKAMGRHHQEGHAHLLLSGTVEGQVLYKERGVGKQSSDVDLSNAELDAYVLGPSSWTSALLALAHDNDIGSNSGSYRNNSRTVNSRVYVNKAFIVIGNFSKSPFYGSVGQMYVPFGTYNTMMVSNPLTQSLARTKDRALLVGMQQQSPNALYGSVYIFKGDSSASPSSRINNGGINVGYRFAEAKWSGDMGVGVLGNIADSVGMQHTGNRPLFDGFGGVDGTGNENIVHRVPAADIRGLINFNHINLLAEYIQATKEFSTADLMQNSHGAMPAALDAEAIYTFVAYDRPSSVGVGYGRTKDALPLGLPAQRYSCVLNTSFWKDTFQSIELRHDINYGATNTSSGSGVAGPAGLGSSDNVITAQFDIYF